MNKVFRFLFYNHLNLLSLRSTNYLNPRSDALGVHLVLQELCLGENASVAHVLVVAGQVFHAWRVEPNVSPHDRVFGGTRELGNVEARHVEVVQQVGLLAGEAHSHLAPLPLVRQAPILHLRVVMIEAVEVDALDVFDDNLGLAAIRPVVHQQLGVLRDLLQIRLLVDALHVAQVLVGEDLRFQLVIGAALLDVLLGLGHRHVEVDDEVRLHQLGNGVGAQVVIDRAGALRHVAVLVHGLEEHVVGVRAAVGDDALASGEDVREAVDVLLVAQHHHSDLELGAVAAVGVEAEVLHVVAARVLRQLRVESSHVEAVRVDVDHVHVRLWNVEHVEVGGELLGEGRLAGGDRAFDDDHLQMKKIIQLIED